VPQLAQNTWRFQRLRDGSCVLNDVFHLLANEMACFPNFYSELCFDASAFSAKLSCKLAAALAFATSDAVSGYLFT
jgi:hypothetical protein